MSNQGDRISQLLEEFKRSRDVMVGELSKVVIGQSDVIELILASIFTRGHVLLVEATLENPPTNSMGMSVFGLR